VRPHLPPGKGQELVGLVLALAAILLLAALASHHPSDPSFLHQTTVRTAARNLIGPVGAQIAAAGFGTIGLAALLVPLLLAVAAWRRLRRRRSQPVAGRAIGACVLLLSLPALLELTLGDVAWRGEPVAAGGGIGRLLAAALEGQIGVTGTFFLLLGGVLIGATLLVQSTLGELVGAWLRRLGTLGESLRLGRVRRRERRQKEKIRQRVLERQMKRLAQERSQAVAREDLPLRVTEKPGTGAFSVRKVAAATGGGAPTAVAVEAPAAQAPARAASRQPEIPFVGPAPRREKNLPPLNLLRLEPITTSVQEDELVRLGEAIRRRCAEFGVEGTIEGINPGPVVTVFEFQPAPGVKVSQIVNLQDDLALALKAEAVRIDRIPGRSTLGIELPNRERALIRLGHLLADERFQRSRSVLGVALGTTIQGQPYYADLATMPHLLVAGATGSGKSVGLQSMITSIVYKAARDSVQFIFIDPKRIELGVYADIPHLKAEVVVEPKKAANALRWAVAEMERRYRLLAEAHVRSLEHYNRAIGDPEVRKRLALSESEAELGAEELSPLPYYVVVIDELADLMLVASSEVESSIARLAQMARAVGIHLIVATQRPSVDVLTGTIKANFPCRIAYATASRHDSRTILDQIGAEKLLGKGDMLFMPPGTSRVLRLHGAYVSEAETAGLVRWLKKQGPPQLDPAVVEAPEEDRSAGAGADGDDELFDEAARLVVSEQKASASFLQRRMRVGFSRAARLIDMMEQDGLLGPPQGSKPREVLVKPDYFETP
jgi:S-DNA-T family DNA segregation ATPase FtsK/SpoIIIE